MVKTRSNVPTILQPPEKKESDVCLIKLAGETDSGKTTVIKAALQHFNGTFDESTQILAIYRTIISNLNSVRGRQLLPEKIRVGISTLHNNIREAKTLSEFNQNLEIIKIWHHTSNTTADYKNWLLSLDDSARYCFEHLKRICEEGYKPTPEDIVHVHSSLNKVTPAEIYGHECKFYDHADDLWDESDIKRRSVIYCVNVSKCTEVAMNLYVQKFAEYVSRNRNHPIFLFFTKYDVFLKNEKELPWDESTIKQKKTNIAKEFIDAARKKKSRVSIKHFFLNLYSKDVPEIKEFMDIMNTVACPYSSS